MESIRDKVRRQHALEEEGRGLGAARYFSEAMPWNPDGSAPAPKELAELPPGQRFLLAALRPAADAIEQWVTDAKAGRQTRHRKDAPAATVRPGGGPRPSALRWLEFSDPVDVAYLTLRTALNATASGAVLQSVARELGRAVIDNIDLNKLRVEHPSGYEGLTRQEYDRARARARSSQTRIAYLRKILENEGARSEVSSTEAVHIGVTLLNVVIEATELFVKELIPQRGGKAAYVLRPTEMVEKWLTEENARSALLTPVHLPMIVRPRPWKGLYGGGYLTRSIRGPLIKRGRDRETWQLYKDADLSKVAAAVNAIQATPWAINSSVLAVMREAWEKGGDIAGLPHLRDLPPPPKPDDIATNEEARTAWKRKAAAVHRRNAALVSHRHRVQQRLWVAEKFESEEEIFFPHFLDSRGRVYPVPASGVHPQADDGGKALLHFAKGVPLGKTGQFWLAVHIANSFGQDKLPFADRVAWTWDHAADLIDSALNPLDGGRFWTTAEAPWVALAAAFEFVGMLEDGERHLSRIPITLDASSSGLQHFSLLLRDPDGARAVNLTPANDPQDVYMVVSRRAQEIVDDDDAPEAAPWKGGKVNRRFAKRPTMTFVYAATRFGMQAMILQTLEALDEEGSPYLGGADNHEAAKYLSRVLLRAITESVTAANGAMNWLRQTARVTSKADLPIRWTAADGLPVVQSYRTIEAKEVHVHWRGRRIALRVGEITDKLDRRKQSNGIAPNFIHGQDSSHLRAVARAVAETGIGGLAVIHDAFGVTAAHTDTLVDILRRTLIEQYQGNVLARFRAEVAEQLPEAAAAHLPELPALGTFDIEQVRHANFAFA